MSSAAASVAASSAAAAAASAAASGNANMPSMTAAELENYQLAQQIADHQNEIQPVHNSISSMLKRNITNLFEKDETVLLKHSNETLLYVPVGILLHYLVNNHTATKQRVYDMISSPNRFKFSGINTGGTSSNPAESDDNIFKAIKKLMEPSKQYQQHQQHRLNDTTNSLVDKELNKNDDLSIALVLKLTTHPVYEASNNVPPTFSTLVQKFIKRTPVNTPHPSLLQLCEQSLPHRCLRKIYIYFRLYMDFGHDWIKRTQCSLVENIERNRDRLIGDDALKELQPELKGKLKGWFNQWAEEVLEIYRGTGTSEDVCREKTKKLNSEYIKMISDKTLVEEHAVSWMNSDFNDTLIGEYIFDGKDDNKAVINQMLTDFKKCGVWAAMMESGTDWITNGGITRRLKLKETRRPLLNLNAASKTIKADNVAGTPRGLLELALSDGLYNAASCGSHPNMLAGSCIRATIKLDSEPVDILGSTVRVIRRPEELVGYPDPVKEALHAGGLIIHDECGNYAMLPGNPEELSVNKLSKYLWGEVVRNASVNQVGDISFIFIFNNETKVERRPQIKIELVTKLKTATDYLQMNAMSKLQTVIGVTHPELKDGIVTVTVDNMYLLGLHGEGGLPFAILSCNTPANANSKRFPKYKVYCNDMNIIATHDETSFNRKRDLFITVLYDLKNLKTHIDDWFDDRLQEIDEITEHIADPSLFFACHRVTTEMKRNIEHANKVCDELLKLRERLMKHPPNSPVDEALIKEVESKITSFPQDLAQWYKRTTDCNSMAEMLSDTLVSNRTFLDNLKEAVTLKKNSVTKLIRKSHDEFLDCYREIVQCVRNSDVRTATIPTEEVLLGTSARKTTKESRKPMTQYEIEHYAICAMAMFLKTNNLQFNEEHVKILHTHAFDKAKSQGDIATIRNKFLFQKGRGSNNLSSILNNIKQSTDEEKEDETYKEKEAKTEFKRLLRENPDFYDIIRASSTLLYILQGMMENGKFSFNKLRPDNIDSNTNQPPSFMKPTSYVNQKIGPTGKQKTIKQKTFTLRSIPVSFLEFVNVCMRDPLLQCNTCPSGLPVEACLLEYSAPACKRRRRLHSPPGTSPRNLVTSNAMSNNFASQQPASTFHPQELRNLQRIAFQTVVPPGALASLFAVQKSNTKPNEMKSNQSGGTKKRKRINQSRSKKNMRSKRITHVKRITRNRKARKALKTRKI